MSAWPSSQPPHILCHIPSFCTSSQSVQLVKTYNPQALSPNETKIKIILYAPDSRVQEQHLTAAGQQN